MRSTTVRQVGLVLSLVLAGGHLQAQIREVRNERPAGGKRFQGGAYLGLALPQGEFSDFVSAGYGLGLYFAYNLDRSGVLALRFDGSYLIYGSETRRRPLSTTVPFVSVDVTTQNTITVFGFGPQITLSHGPIRPYLDGFVGFSYFATQSGVSGTNNSQNFASSTNFDDFTFAWMAGGGLKIRVSRGRRPIFIDLGADYHRNGQVRYLREGSITDNGNGTVTIRPIQSETNLLLIKLGVSTTF